jgi:hypothetical protein
MNTTGLPEDLLDDPRMFSLHIVWSYMILLSFAALIPLDTLSVYVIGKLLLLHTGAHVPVVTGDVARYMMS